MQTIVLFASKAGATEKCARRIFASFTNNEAEIIDLGRSKLKNIDLNRYDRFVIGTPIYMGRIHKRVKKFLTENAQLLQSRELHFFICGLALGDQGIELFQKQVSAKLFAHATQIRQLGNEINPEKLNPLYRTIIKKIIEQEKPHVGLLDAEIAAFVAGIK